MGCKPERRVVIFFVLVIVAISAIRAVLMFETGWSKALLKIAWKLKLLLKMTSTREGCLAQPENPIEVLTRRRLLVMMEIGILECGLKLKLKLMPGKGQSLGLIRKIGWTLREEARAQQPFDNCSSPHHQLIMNIVVWNCRGVLKPNS